jgi:predicted Holliday junction resolvase-like endonuclease
MIDTILILLIVVVAILAYRVIILEHEVEKLKNIVDIHSRNILDLSMTPEMREQMRMTDEFLRDFM